MKPYEQFRELLDGNDLFYKVDFLDNGKTLFRIPQKLKSGGFVDMLLFFEDDNIKILAAKIATIDDPDKLIQCYAIFNELNCNYKYFKMHADSDGDVMLSCDLAMDVVTEGVFSPETVLAYVGASIKVINENYPKIMKLLWA